MFINKKIRLLLGLVLILSSLHATVASNTTWTTGAYSNNAYLSQTLSISDANSLTVSINGETENRWDYITIYDANGNQIERLTGNINVTITVSGSSIRAVLTSDSSITRSGVTISISESETLVGNNTTWTTGPYSNNAYLSQTLSISEANSLTVSINGETENYWDYVTIYDANGNQVERLTGNINETITVSGSSIRAVLSSDSSITRSGVTISISESKTVVGNNRTWTTGAYSNNAYLSQTLSISEASSLTVSINGETESRYDYIIIYDANGNQVAKFTGNINETITVSGSSIRAVLTSDYSITRSGVTVSITSDTISNDIGLKKTGQTVEYRVFDDGYYQRGVDSHYERDVSKEIVTDNVTELMWQDNSAMATLKKPWLTEDKFNICKDDSTSLLCNDSSGDTAITYCQELILGGYNDWRLPTIDELSSIVDYGRSHPAISPIFNNTANGNYWSSTNHLGLHYYAFNIYFTFGSRGGTYKYGHDYGVYYVRCVR